MTLKRRQFLTGGATALAAGAVASPAIAQGAPEIKWRLTSSFPRILDTIFGTAQTFTKYIAEATDNRFQIQTFPAGEIVPGLQALDAVQNGSVECAQTPVYFYFGKDPTLAFGTGVPFGLNARLAAFLVAFRRRRRDHQRGAGEVQCDRLSVRQFRLPDGRLLPQGVQRPRGPQRPQVPHRRPGRPGAGQARRRAAADRAGRRLSGARKGHDRRRRIRRPLRRREARAPQGRQVLLLPGLVGRRRDDASRRQHRAVEQAAEELPAHRAGRVRSRQQLDARRSTTP